MNTYDLAIQEVKLKKGIVEQGRGVPWSLPWDAEVMNRFPVWPNEYQEKGAIGVVLVVRAADNIQFLIDFKGMDFKAACQF